MTSQLGIHPFLSCKWCRDGFPSDKLGLLKLCQSRLCYIYPTDWCLVLLISYVFFSFCFHLFLLTTCSIRKCLTKEKCQHLITTIAGAAAAFGEYSFFQHVPSKWCGNFIKFCTYKVNIDFISMLCVLHKLLTSPLLRQQFVDFVCNFDV